MRGGWMVCIFFMLGLLLFPLKVQAQEDALWSVSGAQEIAEEEGLAGVLDGISADDPESLLSFSMKDFFGSVTGELRRAVQQPIKTAGKLLGVILLSAFAGAVGGNKDTSRTYAALCTICAVLTAAEPITHVLSHASAVLEGGASFMLSFSAVFGAVLAVSGGIATAAAYRGAVVLLCEAAMQVSAHFLLPLLSMVLAMSIVDAVNPAISLEGIIRLVHKSTVWILGLFMSLFLAMLSVQSMAAVSMDRFGTKTSKFMISTFVPFVGSAVSDAYGTVLGSMHILRSATGMLGILSLLVLLLPVLLELILYRLILSAAAAVSEMLGAGSLKRLFKNMESVFAAALSVAVSFSVMFIVSAAVMLLLGGDLAAV